MDRSGYPVENVKRIEVDPSDVRIVSVGRAFGRGDADRPQAGPGAWLRRNRLRIAGPLALVEALLWALDVSKLALLAVAAFAVAFHFFVTPRIPSYTVRQLSWTVAFAQALIAIGSILLFVVSAFVAIALFAVLVGVVLFGAAALLGDRR